MLNSGMLTSVLKSPLGRAALALGLGAAGAGAQAASVTFMFDYMATNLKGDFATASGGTAVPVGSITLTDLSDLGLGDGKTGVRSTITLNGLSQFSNGGVGSIFVSSYELNFPGTSTGNVGSTELTSATDGVNWRYVSGLNVNTARVGGPIEFAENGATNGWGAIVGDPAFEQEINFATGAFTNGLSSTIDFLNNGENGFSGFSVAQLLANPVRSTDPTRPDAYAWIKIRSTNQGIQTGSNGRWWEPATFNAAGGRLDVISVTPVPEPQTWAMMTLGLGLLGGVARRRAARG